MQFVFLPAYPSLSLNRLIGSDTNWAKEQESSRFPQELIDINKLKPFAPGEVERKTCNLPTLIIKETIDAMLYTSHVILGFYVKLIERCTS